jgi:Sulfate permease family
MPSAASSLHGHRAHECLAAELRARLSDALTFLVGVVQLLLGAARLGFVVNFLTRPAESSFENIISLDAPSASADSLLSRRRQARNSRIKT